MDLHMQHHTTRALALAASLGLACFEDAGPGPDGPTDASPTGSDSTEEPATGTQSAHTGSSGSTGAGTSAPETSAEGPTTSGDATSTGWGAGPYYGDCDANLLCGPPEECLYYGASRICSTPCETVADCPPAPLGGAVPACLEASPEPYEPRECILACDNANDNCPAGMTCHAISNLWFCMWTH